MPPSNPMPIDPPAKSTEDPSRLAAMEAKAVLEATATADDSFVPSPSLLNAPDPKALLQQVDGPALDRYEGKESVYVGRSVPVALRMKLDVPIHVTAPGSVVEYAVESKGYDIGFSVSAEREEGITVVKEASRVESHNAPITGKFLVGTVPCMLVFCFDNEYSWFREKLISYRITVTPPSPDILLAGRRRRAKAALKTVQDDSKSAQQRLQSAVQQKSKLEAEITKLEQELGEKKKSLQVVQKEETWLQSRTKLRKEQQELLQHRLTKGWEDEP